VSPCTGKTRRGIILFAFVQKASTENAWIRLGFYIFRRDIRRAGAYYRLKRLQVDKQTHCSQTQELVNYIVRNRSEEERTTFIRPFQEALRTEKTQKPIEEDEERRRTIFSMVLIEIKGLGEGSDKGRPSCGSCSIITDRSQEAEGFFNLVYSHLFTLFPPESSIQKQYLSDLLQVISTSPSGNTPLKYRLYVKCAFLYIVVLPVSFPRLSNLYNAISRTSSFRLPVYESLLNIATTKDELEVLQISQKDVQTWLSEWNITPEEKSAFLKSIVDAFVKTGQMRVFMSISKPLQL
jgi:translation initiation factor 3 subunit M